MKLDVNAEYQGLSVLTRQQIVYQQRRQALEDYPLLRRIHRALRTSCGRRMARWEKLTFAAELLLLGYSASQAARAAEIMKLTCFRLRDRLKEAGILSHDWKAARRPKGITERQQECRELMAQGLGCRRIARCLNITHTSAKALIRRAKRNLNGVVIK